MLIVLVLAAFCPSGFFALQAFNAQRFESGEHFVAPATVLDDLVPLVPGAIWVYITYYILCLMPALLVNSQRRLRAIALGFFVEFALCFLGFALLPIRMEQPAVPGTDTSARLLRVLFQLDPGYNIFPSLHVANAALVAIWFARLARPRLALPVVAWAVLVAVSTVLVKQHYIVDVFAGVAVALVADRVAFRRLGPDTSTAPGALSPLATGTARSATV